MIRKGILAVAVAAAASLATAPAATGSCVTCTVSQDCDMGTMGSHCIIFYYEGERWCNWDGGCNMTQDMQVSPSGTYAVRGGWRGVQMAGAIVDPCSAFVGAFTDSASGFADDVALIWV